MRNKERIYRIVWILAAVLIVVGVCQSLPVRQDILGANGRGVEVSLHLSYYLYAGLMLILTMLLLNRTPFGK